MRDFFRYLLVLSVVGLGFYGASQHRVPDESPGAMDELAELETLPQPPTQGGAMQDSQPAEVIPLAALLDADRSSSDESQPESPANLKRVPQIARQSTPAPKARIEGTSTEEVVVAEEAAPDTEQTAESSPVQSTSDSESDPPRPSDPPRRDLTAASQSSATAKFPLPKLAVRPGNRFAVPDPVEHDRFKEPKADAPFDPAWDEPDPGDFDPFHQFASEDSPSEPIPLTKTQADEASAAIEPSRDTLIHHVEAGDTLRKLAERYLGDREKYQAIFEANAKILPDPRLLPIGVDLQIPVLATTEVAKDQAADALLDDPQHDDPLDDLFAPPTPSERSSRHLEPIPPQALPNPPLDAWRPSLR